MFYWFIVNSCYGETTENSCTRTADAHHELGYNRHDIFESEEDMARIKDDLAVSLDKSVCSLHAYIIMTNHLHLPVTPKDKTELAKFMQSVANRYVRYFSAQHQGTGTVWEGRFKSCLVGSDQYLYRLYIYIEMNPVRAGMVESPADYRWSSYHHNALCEKDDLITEPKIYKGLASERCAPVPAEAGVRSAFHVNHLPEGMHNINQI